MKGNELKKLTVEIQPVKNMMKLMESRGNSKGSVGFFHGVDSEIRIDFSRPQSILQLAEANCSLWNQYKKLKTEYGDHLKRCNGVSSTTTVSVYPIVAPLI